MSLFGAIGKVLGTSSDFQANPYQVDPNAFKYGGPSQQQLGGYVAGAQGESEADRQMQMQARQAQGNYVGQLQAAAAGGGPSQAQSILQQGADRAAAQSTSLARSGATGNPAAQAAAMRNAMQQGAAGMTSTGAQAAQIKSQEQQNAMNQLGGAINSQRGMDLQSQGMGNQMAQGYLGAQQSGAAAQMQGQIDQQQLQAQSQNQANQINAGVSQSNAAGATQLLGATAQAVSGGMASDERLKADIQAESALGDRVRAQNNASDLAEASKLGPGFDKGKEADMLSDRAQHGPNGWRAGLANVLGGFGAGMQGRMYKPISLDPTGGMTKRLDALEAAAKGHRVLAPVDPASAPTPPTAPADPASAGTAAPAPPPQPTWPGSYGMPQGPQTFQPGQQLGQYGGLAVAVPPPPVPSGMTMKTDIASAAAPEAPPDEVGSDERIKAAMRPSEMIDARHSEADAFLSHLHPYTYRYKDPTNEPASAPTGGRYLGVMAQDVEQAPDIGRQIVKDTPRGKMLEGGALMSAMAGGLGRLHERLSALEGRRNGVR